MTLASEAPPDDGGFDALIADYECGADGLSEEQLLHQQVVRELRMLRARTLARQRFDAEQRPPASVPPPLTLRERLARPRTRTRWRIVDLQPADSRVILAAQYKAGKTTAVGNILRSLADGDPLFGTYDTNRADGMIALIDFEMSENQLDEWLADQHIRNDDRIVVYPMRGKAAAFDLRDEKVCAEWAARLGALGVTYLIWDCLRPVLDALGLNEHNEAGRLLTALDALLDQAAVPEALVVHHMGHSGERSRGDSRLRDWPDVEWQLVRLGDEAGSPRYFKAYGRDVDVAEAELAFDPSTRHLTIGGGSRKDAGMRAALQDILAELERSEGGLSGRQVEDLVTARTEHPRAMVRSALKKGVTAGDILASPGDKRAVIHTLPLPSAPVRRSAPPVRRHTPESECASAPVRIYGALHSRTTGQVGGQPAEIIDAAHCGGCGYPLDPVMAAGGETTHPGCE